MDFRGSGKYIPRYDTTPPPENEEDVGDLNFDDVFAHGYSQQRQQNNQHDRQPLQQLYRDQPRGPPTAAADPGNHGVVPQERSAFGFGGANGTPTHQEEELIFDLDLEDDDAYVYNNNNRRRHAAPPPPWREPPVEDGPGENVRRRQEYIEELSAEVVRQQRYVDHLREKMRFGPFPEADGGREGVRGALGMAQEALRTLREALMDAEWEGEQRGDRIERGGENNDNGYGSGDELERRRGRGRTRKALQRGPDPAARRRTEQNLAQLRETEMQMRWAGATPEDLREVVEEIQYLQDALDGKYLTWGRGKSLSPSSVSSISSSPTISASLSPITSPPPSPFSASSPHHHHRRHRRHRHHTKPKHDRTTGCYHPFPPLSQQDPRLPPPGEARAEPIELHDAEGPRYLALVTLDNPDPAARRAEQKTLAQARQAFARYEAGWYTVVERALGCRALTVLSVGPRGAICVVQEGRLDVLGAILRAGEEPVGGNRSWTFLGVGVGGAEGFAFCLHNKQEEEEEGGGGGDD